jgi:hypothetical protein
LDIYYSIKPNRVFLLCFKKRLKKLLAAASEPVAKKAVGICIKVFFIIYYYPLALSIPYLYLWLLTDLDSRPAFSEGLPTFPERVLTFSGVCPTFKNQPQKSPAGSNLSRRATSAGNESYLEALAFPLFEAWTRNRTGQPCH